MKSKILSLLILFSPILTINAQTWNGTNPIWTSSNVGIGTSNVNAPLTVYGISNIFPRAANGGDVRSFSVTYIATKASFIDNDYPIVLATGGGNQPLILDAPRIGIGTINPQCQLDIIGTIRAREIKVDMNGADFVFEKGYKLMPLSELEKFVKEKKHLPDVASAKQMQENGTELGNLNSLLLQKIEEMTLYMIKQNKKIQILERKMKSISRKSK